MKTFQQFCEDLGELINILQSIERKNAPKERLNQRRMLALRASKEASKKFRKKD